MTDNEITSMLALLGAAFFNGRPMPKEAAAVYAEHLRPLDILDVHPAVNEIIDTNTTGFFPAIGSIVEIARDHAEARAHLALMDQSRAIEPRTDWVKGAPWFIKLQIARQKDQQPAGYPLAELRDDAAGLFAECGRRGLNVTQYEIERWGAPR